MPGTWYLLVLHQARFYEIYEKKDEERSKITWSTPTIMRCKCFYYDSRYYFGVQLVEYPTSTQYERRTKKNDSSARGCIPTTITEQRPDWLATPFYQVAPLRGTKTFYNPKCCLNIRHEWRPNWLQRTHTFCTTVPSVRNQVWPN